MDVDISTSSTTGVTNVTVRSVATKIEKEGTGNNEDLGKIKPIWEAHLSAMSPPSRSGIPNSVIPLSGF